MAHERQMEGGQIGEGQVEGGQTARGQTVEGQTEGATAARQAWMGLLAKAAPADLESAWDALEPKPAWRWLRKPETGLVMVRGRAGGSGQAFNLGEMTVTRCVLVTEEGVTGHAHVAGRNARHAELAAAFDALLQDETRRADLDDSLLAPLTRKRSEAERRRAEEAAATKVEFFTMVRGED